MLKYPGNSVAELYELYRSFDLLVDSRRLSRADRTLFFALPGERTDGHAFIEDLYGRGVRHFVVDPDRARSQVQREVLRSEEITLIITRNPLDLLQALAAHHRRQFGIPVVGITGSNGKTIVKDWLVELLRPSLRVCASPRSFNSQIGVPLSVWRLRADHEVAVFEAGVSKRGEMQRLAKIIQPTCGAFTVLGTAHAAGFASPEEKLQQKLQLFQSAKWVVVPADDNATKAELRKMGVEVVPQLGHGRRLVEVDEVPLAFDFPDWPQLYLDNACTAIATAHLLGIGHPELQRAFSNLQPLSNRLEQREGLHGGPVINDSYSNDLSALVAALEFAVAQNPHEQLTLILGTLQVGSSNEELQKVLAGKVTRLITVGRKNQWLRAPNHYATPAALLADLENLSFHNETVLVKGASFEDLSRVADALSRRQHRTVLRIDLAALRHNFSAYRKQVGAKMIVMVKAGAYGGGALPVALTLANAGADYLAVAYPDEGAALRRGGIRLPIMVLNAEPYTYGRMRDDALEPVVHSLANLRQAVAAGLRVHLELDTGMGRLGFWDEIGALYEELCRPEYASSVISVFTHLAASEDPVHDDFTKDQLVAFRQIADRIEASLGYRPFRHALNTNGISRFPEFGLDYVRLGIGLYGIGDANRPELKPVHRFSTRISAIYDHPAGTTISYGRKGLLIRDSRIAVLAVGYADGLPRLAGEGRFSVLICGKPAPIIGSVCMDMTMVDVTDIPEAVEGEEAVVFGPEQSIDLLAAAALTIPYEILTGVGERVHRVYVQE